MHSQVPAWCNELLSFLKPYTLNPLIKRELELLGSCPFEARRTYPKDINVKNLLPVLTACAPELSSTLMLMLSNYESQFQWGQTYTAAQSSETFVNNYGWFEIIGTKGAIPSDKIALGCLVLGANTYYPKHSHPAVEFYIPLSGRAQWYTATNGWQTHPNLHEIYHASNEIHAMKTDSSPLIALYIWCGEIETSALLSD